VRALPTCPGDRDTVDDKMNNVVDVRDIAEALVRVYETPEASGRYICRSYPMSMTEILDTSSRASIPTSATLTSKIPIHIIINPTYQLVS